MTICIGERVRSDGSLSWWSGARCEACGSAYECDGVDFLPEHYRDLTIAQEGLWEIAISQLSKHDKVNAGLVFKEMLQLTTQQTAQFMRAIPGPVWQGTQTEVEWLCHHLRRRNVECTARLRTPPTT